MLLATQLTKLNKKSILILYLITGIIFSILYYLINYYDEDSFTSIDKLKKETYFDFLHYSFVTQTTVGYGNVYPNNSNGKLINMLHLLWVIVLTIYILE